MKILDSVQPNRQAIISRLIVLNICKEAQELGIKLRSLPSEPRTCGRLLSDMLSIVCPDMQKQVQYCTIKSVARYMTAVGSVQATLCPWAVQILKVDGSIFPISKLIRISVPMRSSSRYDGHIIEGAIGEFAKMHGFSLICRITPKGDTKFLAGSENESRLEDIEARITHPNRNNPPRPTDLDRELHVIKANMVSPIAFCRCIRAMYKSLTESAIGAIEANKHLRKVETVMEVISNISKKDAPPKIVPRLVSKGERIQIRKVESTEATVNTEHTVRTR